MNTEVSSRSDIFAAMNSGKPFKSYKKTIQAQAKVTMWDNFLSSPVDVIVKGDPRSKDDSCIIDVFSEQEKVFFERMNRKHFQDGIIIPFERPQKVEEETTMEQYSDEQLTEIVNSKFLALSAALNKTESTATLFRIRALAEDNDKSEKIIRAIDARISEVQAKEYSPVKPLEE